MRRTSRLVRHRGNKASDTVEAPRSLTADRASTCGDFAEYLLGRGYASATVDAYLQQLRRIWHWFDDSGGGLSLNTIFREEVWSFLRRHLRGRSPLTLQNHRKVLFHWLKFRGRFQLRARPPLWQPLVSDYIQYLRVHRGVGQSVLENSEREAQSFLSWCFQERMPRWTHVRTADIWAYARHRVQAKTPRSANNCLRFLRGFLRYVHLCGQCPPELVAAVPRVADYGRVTRSASLSEKQRERLLQAFRRSVPEGQRDYAMALCMLDLGLRATEVIRLRLSDIDWRHRRLAVPKTKTDRGRDLPLPPHIMTALNRYVCRDRPRSEVAQLFLRHGRRTGQPLTRGMIKQAMRRAYRRCGLPATWCGTHRLRHTFASRLYLQNTRPKTVADLLGHRHLDTTNDYVHIGPNALRPLAQPWPIR
jgi:integrase/recombinase XerD